VESQNVLYHYTSLASLLKIVQSKHLWASEIHYLNDHGEMLAGVDAIERTILDEVEGSQKNRGLLDAIHDTIGRIEHHNVFVGSFSQNGDLLSQWRAYCTPCEGVSIGIDARELADASAQAGFQLRRCIYDEATLCIEVKRLLSELVADLDRVGRTEENPDVHRGNHPGGSMFQRQWLCRGM
jgi:hypothetical protein